MLEVLEVRSLPLPVAGVDNAICAVTSVSVSSGVSFGTNWLK